MLNVFFNSAFSHSKISIAKTHLLQSLHMFVLFDIYSVDYWVDGHVLVLSGTIVASCRVPQVMWTQLAGAIAKISTHPISPVVLNCSLASLGT